MVLSERLMIVDRYVLQFFGFFWPQSQLLQEGWPCNVACQMDAARGLHGGDLHLQD